MGRHVLMWVGKVGLATLALVAWPLGCDGGDGKGSGDPSAIGTGGTGGSGGGTASGGGGETATTATSVANSGGATSGNTSGNTSGGAGGVDDSTTDGSAGAGGAPFCPEYDDPNPVSPPSCDGLPETCGPCADESCCTSLLVPGGSFYRSYDNVLYTTQDYPATLSDFRLDRFEVTVGRFRPFVAAVIGGWRPEDGSGTHAHVAEGNFPGGDGWKAEEWDDWLPDTESEWNSDSHLLCDPELSTWTPLPGPNENLAMNCLTWVEAYAFCIWDGGFLPTEAEWNYAAAGGDEAREYPWGNTEPAPDLAVYYCRSGGTPGCLWPVGSRPLGDGRFGQADMAGSSWEWALDSFIEYQMDWLDCLTAADACTDYPIQDCQDCAYLQTTFEKVIRGGSMTDALWNLRSAKRDDAGFLDVRNDIGMRCARAP